jgi:hypothetical protein
MLSSDEGRYFAKPAVEAGVTTAGSMLLKGRLGGTMVKEPFSIYGKSVGTTLSTFAGSYVGFYAWEVVRGKRACSASRKSFKGMAEEVAYASATTGLAGTGALLVLQMGGLKNLNPKSALINIPMGALVGEKAYEYICPYIVNPTRQGITKNLLRLQPGY